MKHFAPLLLAMLAGCWYRTPAQVQRDYAQTLLPAAAPEAKARPEGQIKLLRVRVYADRDYQAQTPRWESHIEDQLDRANRVLEAQLSVRLQVESIRVWDRHGGLRGLESALADLIARDPGDAEEPALPASPVAKARRPEHTEVDWVIAFVSSLDVFSATHEQLGIAALFSRHLVVRGISNAAEMDEIDSALDKLPREERAALARERRIHKETSVLLHEWAHTLGVFHDAVPGSLMAPFYEPSRSMFTEGAIRLLQAALAYRNDRTPEGRAAWAKVYRKGLADESAAFDAQMRAQATAAADQFFAVAAPDPRETVAAKPTPEPPTVDDVLSDADRAAIAKVLRADDAGTPDRAARLLAPLAAAHPGNARVQQLGCYLALRSRPRASETARTCRDAAALPGATGEAMLLAAQSALAVGDRSSAVVHLSRAEQRLLADSAPKASWLRAAQLYDGAGTCSGAERAVAHAADVPGAAQILSDCKRLRRLAALPASGIAIEREHEYVSLVQSAEREALSGRQADAVRSARSLDETFPGAPGGAVIDCLVDGRSKTT
ncbi:MAG: matrixin family metalloprotease, partial [Myxococcales bacterium]